jgi:hypothetical protein
MMIRYATLLITLTTAGLTACTEDTNDRQADCVAEQGVTYLCGFVLPEDIVNVGATGLVLASGHRAPGHMYLIDPESDDVSELIHTDSFTMQHDTDAWPDCPGPLNLESFDVHGLSLAEISPGRFSIYSTSHGEREAIEIYELDLSGEDRNAALTWTGCVLLQRDGYFNSVARLADGGFVTTRMRATNANMANLRGSITGQVFEWHPGGSLEPVAGTELSLPNGIAVSIDERYMFVTASGTGELIRFDRSAAPIGKRVVSTPMGPDNIRWGNNSRLIIAGPHEADPATCGEPRCFAGWEVIEVDPASLAITSLGGADETASLQRASAAIRVGDEIWVGSNQDRIARFTPN